MSIPVKFWFYDVDGKYLKYGRPFTISLGQNMGDLNLISQRLQECSFDEHKQSIHDRVKYAVPMSAPDYMFDLEDPCAILPNKFKDTQ